MIDRFTLPFDANDHLSTITTWLGAGLALALISGLGWTSAAHAQRAPGDVGIGGQIGNPSGLSLKVYRPGFPSYDILAAWDLDRFYFINVHGLYEHHVGNSERVHVFFGPGGFVGVDDRVGDDEVDVGLSGRLGLNVLAGPFEIYVQATPRLEVVPDTEGDIGGGIGLRYYF